MIETVKKQGECRSVIAHRGLYMDMGVREGEENYEISDKI